MRNLVKSMFGDKAPAHTTGSFLNRIQKGSTLVFGFMPQAALSGKRLQVSGLSTYVFENDKLLSYTLSADREQRLNMIIAESRGDKYLAISRKITRDEQARLFDEKDLAAVQEQTGRNILRCKEGVVGFRGWVLPTYFRSLHNVSGKLYRGDWRFKPVPATNDELSHEFIYTLLVSESNEHAIEIERYLDGRVDIYTTIFRRVTDIAQVLAPVVSPAAISGKQDSVQKKSPATPVALKEELLLTEEVGEDKNRSPRLVVKKDETGQKVVRLEPVEKTDKQEPAMQPAAPEKTPESAKEVRKEPVIEAKKPDAVDAKPQTQEAKVEPKLEKALPAKEKEVAKTKEAVKVEVRQEPKPEVKAEPKLAAAEKVIETKPEAKPDTPKAEVASAPLAVEAVTSAHTNMIECNVNIARHVIDEAHRSNLSLNELIRKVIDLPVTLHETVHITLSLTDEEYALLAERYGIDAAERPAILKQIVSELAAFAGEK